MNRAGDLGRFLAVVGPSGSGKSSTGRAGLIPALRSRGLPGSEQWYIVTVVPGAQPLAALAGALRPVAPSGVEAEDLAALLRADQRGLVQAARLIFPTEPQAELLLVIDTWTLEECRQYLQTDVCPKEP